MLPDICGVPNNKRFTGLYHHQNIYYAVTDQGMSPVKFHKALEVFLTYANNDATFRSMGFYEGKRVIILDHIMQVVYLVDPDEVDDIIAGDGNTEHMLAKAQDLGNQDSAKAFVALYYDPHKSQLTQANDSDVTKSSAQLNNVVSLRSYSVA